MRRRANIRGRWSSFRGFVALRRAPIATLAQVVTALVRVVGVARKGKERKRTQKGSSKSRKGKGKRKGKGTEGKEGDRKGREKEKEKEEERGKGRTENSAPDLA